MKIQEMIKFLRRYGVPILFGALLAGGFIYTSMQPNSALPTKSITITRAVPNQIVRATESPRITPTALKVAQATKVPERGNATEPAGTPAGMITAQLTGTPTVTKTTQPAGTPTATNVVTLAEKKVTVTNGTSLRVPRTRHTVTRLNNGKVLVTGGSSALDTQQSSVDLFDPATGAFNSAEDLNAERHGHTATLLKDGRVLVVGGYASPEQWLDDAEIYDPVSDTWSVVLPYYSHGTAHTATSMNDGRVLVVGGCYDANHCTESVEIFDPLTNIWSEAEPLETDLHSHTAQVLEDGRVLVIGGVTADGSYPDYDAQIYNPNTNTWASTAPMIHPRRLAESVRLTDGRILVAGGLSIETPPEMLVSAEIYDPHSDKWIAVDDLSVPRYAFLLVKLADDQILAIGGSRDYEDTWSDTSFVREIESYNPFTNRWQITGLLQRPGAFSAGALLADGRFWLTGGQTKTTYLSDTWLITKAP